MLDTPGPRVAQGGFGVQAVAGRGAVLVLQGEKPVLQVSHGSLGLEVAAKQV